MRINRVEFSLGGQPAIVDSTAPYDAEFPTAALAPGDHTLTVTAVDGTGQATTTTRPARGCRSRRASCSRAAASDW